MGFYLLQILNGLSYASTLFLMAAGLTLIFGVTRIINFAHGSFYMLGALLAAHWLVDWFPSWADSGWGYPAAMLLGAAAAALVGAVVDLLLLRRMASVPSLYQLVATFGLSLFLHDAMLWAMGPTEVFAPRFPGLKGSVPVLGEYFPVYQLLLLALGPLVWLGLHLLLSRSRFGRLVRAATQDATMLDALGINPRPLMAGVVVLGCALAGLAGALQLPREPANLQMAGNVIVETFVVVVTGGLGSVGGAFGAAVLIGLIHSLGVSLFPQASLVLVFATMAVILVLRPHGLAGTVQAVGVRESAEIFHGIHMGYRKYAIYSIAFVTLCGVAWISGPYQQSLAGDAMILLLFGLSLQAAMALGGLVSFGHAAFFALGAYGAALSASVWGWPLPLALAAGCGLALAVAALFGAAVVRSSGVYLAMLSLALAQIIWAGAVQWVGLTGGDNGVIGLQLVTAAQRPVFYLLLVLLSLAAVWALRRLALSSIGAALQAARDAPQRAAASGLRVAALRYQAFVLSALGAGLAGGLFAAHKGAVFPAVADVSNSVDALLVVLLGGVHQLWATAVGSGLLTWASASLGRDFAYWHGALGLLIMLLMALAPSGLLGPLSALLGSAPALPKDGR